jgi:hypothetical protein
MDEFPQVGVIRSPYGSAGSPPITVHLHNLAPEWQDLIRKELIHREQISALSKVADEWEADAKAHPGETVGRFLQRKGSQAEKVKDWLHDHGEIGLKESLFEDNGIGSARLSALIHVLRTREKMNIKTRRVHTKTGKTVGRYVLYPGPWDGTIDEVQHHDNLRTKIEKQISFPCD